MHFNDPIVYVRVQEKILKLMDNDNSEMINPTVPEETVNTLNNQNQYDLWGLHKTLEQKRSDTRLTRGELNQFLHRNVIK